MNIKELIAKDNIVVFLYYRKRELWYDVQKPVPVRHGGDYGPRANETSIHFQSLFQFPVPISDTGDGTFLAQDKAILFQRYIREQLKAHANEQH